MLPAGLFEFFRDRHDETRESHLLAFKLMLQSQLKEQLGVEIADIQFGFGNHRLLDYLEARAVALKAGKHDRVAEIESDMTKFKNANLDHLMTPRLAYIVFDTTDQAQKALAEKPMTLAGDKVQDWIDKRKVELDAGAAGGQNRAVGGLGSRSDVPDGLNLRFTPVQLPASISWRNVAFGIRGHGKILGVRIATSICMGLVLLALFALCVVASQ